MLDGEARKRRSCAVDAMLNTGRPPGGHTVLARLAAGTPIDQIRTCDQRAGLSSWEKW